jgi:hypothetical protein
MAVLLNAAGPFAYAALDPLVVARPTRFLAALSQGIPRNNYYDFIGWRGVIM